MNQIESKIISAIQTNPMATQQELADELGMSRESVAGYIMRLTRKGAILGKGYILPEHNNIVVIGGANVDLTGTSASKYCSGDSNPGHVQQSAGGVGRNIAENLARLGSNISMITLLGKDNRGSFLIEHAREAGIHTQDFIQLAEYATSTYLALNNSQGELVGSIADMDIIDQLTPALLQSKLSRLQAASQLVVEANLPMETLSWLAEQPLKNPIIADAVSATKAIRLIPLLPKLSLLKVNVSEARAILNIAEDVTVTENELILMLHKHGVQSVLLSLGSRGALFSNGNDFYSANVPDCNMVSDTGAGDALLAGFIVARQQLETPQQQLMFAIACAACTLEANHAVNTQLSEQFVSSRFETYLQSKNATTATAETEI
jgi:pseudouridine kinase